VGGVLEKMGGRKKGEKLVINFRARRHINKKNGFK